MAIDAESMSVYRETVKKRDATAQSAKSAARERAWRVACQAADRLRARFRADRVVVYGSLVEFDGLHFGMRSDIDLAAWGIDPDDYFVAVAHFQDLSPEFSVDLVAMERCPDRLQAAIVNRGCDL